MAKVLVLYYSASGNTRKMAEFVAEGATNAGGDVTLKKIQDANVDELLDYDAIIMGSPTYYGHSTAKIRNFIDESVKYHTRLVGKIGGAFASSANTGGGNETTVLDILHAMLIHGMIVQGDALGDHYGPVSIGAPDERVEKQCRKLGEKITKLAIKLYG